MKKSDLKSGHVVRLNSSYKLGLIIDDVIVFDDGYEYLGLFDEDLEIKNIGIYIKTVYQVKNFKEGIISAYNINNLTCIYEKQLPSCLLYGEDDTDLSWEIFN